MVHGACSLLILWSSRRAALARAITGQGERGLPAWDQCPLHLSTQYDSLLSLRHYVKTDGSTREQLGLTSHPWHPCPHSRPASRPPFEGVSLHRPPTSCYVKIPTYQAPGKEGTLVWGRRRSRTGGEERVVLSPQPADTPPDQRGLSPRTSFREYPVSTPGTSWVTYARLAFFTQIPMARRYSKAKVEWEAASADFSPSRFSDRETLNDRRAPPEAAAPEQEVLWALPMCTGNTMAQVAFVYVGLTYRPQKGHFLVAKVASAENQQITVSQQPPHSEGLYSVYCLTSHA